jgi:hypothetical protein
MGKIESMIDRPGISPNQQYQPVQSDNSLSLPGYSATQSPSQ